MGKRLSIAAIVMLQAAFVTVVATADTPPEKPKVKKPAEKPKENPAKDVFGLTKIWEMNLELSAKEYDAMQPAMPMRGPGGFPGGPGGGFPGGPPQPEKP